MPFPSQLAPLGATHGFGKGLSVGLPNWLRVLRRDVPRPVAQHCRDDIRASSGEAVERLDLSLAFRAFPVVVTRSAAGWPHRAPAKTARTVTPGTQKPEAAMTGKMMAAVAG